MSLFWRRRHKSSFIYKLISGLGLKKKQLRLLFIITTKCIWFIKLCRLLRWLYCKCGRIELIYHTWMWFFMRCNKRLLHKIRYKCFCSAVLIVLWNKKNWYKQSKFIPVHTLNYVCKYRSQINFEIIPIYA